MVGWFSVAGDEVMREKIPLGEAHRFRPDCRHSSALPASLRPRSRARAKKVSGLIPARVVSYDPKSYRENDYNTWPRVEHVGSLFCSLSMCLNVFDLALKFSLYSAVYCFLP